MTVDHYIREN